MSNACTQRDLVKGPARWMLWVVPAGVIVIGGFLGPSARMLLWTSALLVMGVSCVINARTCGRIHCFLTGPLYLTLAFLTVLRGNEVVTFPWLWIVVALVGGTVAAHVPEWIRGQYLRSET